MQYQCIKDLHRFIGIIIISLFWGSYTASRNRTPNVTGSETEFNSREHKVLKWTQERKEQFERVKSIVKTLYRNCTF